MNPYDLAHQLARSMKDSEEYREYERLRESAYEDETNRALLDEYKRLQFRMRGPPALPRAKICRRKICKGCSKSARFCSLTRM